MFNIVFLNITKAIERYVINFIQNDLVFQIQPTYRPAHWRVKIATKKNSKCRNFQIKLGSNRLIYSNINTEYLYMDFIISCVVGINVSTFDFRLACVLQAPVNHNITLN